MNRREFISGGLSALGMGAIASPIRSVVGAAETGIGDVAVPTAADYIQDGLVAMWDGIENADWGVHDPEATIWKDLMGNRDLTLQSGVVVNDDHMLMSNGGSYGATLNSIIYDIASAEIVLEIDSPISSQNNYGAGVIVANGNMNSSAKRFIGLIAESKTTGSRKMGFQVTRYLQANTDVIGRMSLSVAVDGTTNAFYKDSMDIPLTTYDETWNNGGTVFMLGRRYDGNWWITHKQFCVRLYNRVLSPLEIRYNYLIDQMRFGL